MKKCRNVIYVETMGEAIRGARTAEIGMEMRFRDLPSHKRNILGFKSLAPSVKDIWTITLDIHTDVNSGSHFLLPTRWRILNGEGSS